MPTRRRFPNLPDKVAIVDSDTNRIIRWEDDTERQNPLTEDVATMRARNPSELAITDRSNPEHNNEVKTMERENQVTEYASTAMSLLQTGGVIFAGQMIASYSFDWIGRQFFPNASNTVDKSIKIVGSALAGGILYSSTKNEYLRGVALGHAIYAGATGLDWALKSLFGEQSDSTSDGGDVTQTNGSETDGETTGTQGLRRLSRGGMSGGFSADQRLSQAAVASSGGSRNTVMSGA